MSVGENIRRLRKEANLTQEELAEQLGVARSTITQWECGWSMPRMGKLRRIAEVFHTSYTSIVSEEPAVDMHEHHRTHRATIPLLSMSDITLAQLDSMHVASNAPANTPLTTPSNAKTASDSRDFPAALPNRPNNMAVAINSKYSIEVPSSLLERHARACAVTVESNQMDRVAPKGLVLVFDPALRPSNGQIAILHTQEHGTIVRRWFRGSNTLMLVADSHTKQDDIVLPSENSVVVVGTVVWIQSPRELG